MERESWQRKQQNSVSASISMDQAVIRWRSKLASKGQDLWCTIRSSKAFVCFVLFSVTQGLAIFAREQNKQILASSRPLHRHHTMPGCQGGLCARCPLQLHNTAACILLASWAQEAGQAGNGQKAGEACGHRTNGHLFSGGCWAATFINDEQKRKDARQQAYPCAWCSREEKLVLTSLDDCVICINIINIWNRESRICGSYWTSVLRCPNSSFALAVPSSWSTPFPCPFLGW